jgi:hypothetical protein
MVLNNDLGRCSHGPVKKKTQNIQLPGQQPNQLSPEYNSRELLLYHPYQSHISERWSEQISVAQQLKRGGEVK